MNTGNAKHSSRKNNPNGSHKSRSLAEEQLRLVKMAARLGIYDYDIRTGSIEWDDWACELWGVDSAEEVTYEVFMAGIHPDDRTSAQQALEQALDANGYEAYHSIFRVIHRHNGRERWVEAGGQLSFEDGQPVRLIGTLIDITERKRAELELEQNHRKLSEILDSIQDDFYVLDRNWVFVYASRLFTSKINKEPEDFVGNNIWDMFPKHVGTSFEENLRAAMEKGEIRRFEIPGKYTNAWYRMTVFPSAEGITVLGRDITERKQAEDALQRSEERLRRVLETDTVGVIFLNHAGEVIHANEVFLRMTGYTREQVDRRELSWRAMTPPEWLQVSEEQMALLAQTGRLGPYEKEYFMADGSRQWMLFAGRDLGDGTISEYCINISDRKRTEEALRESERLLRTLNETLEHRVQEKTEEVRRLAADLVVAVQRERMRISHILHDDLQQRIYALQMQLNYLHDALQSRGDTLWQDVEQAETELQDILQLTRQTSIDLSPPILPGEGLAHAISWLATQMWQRYGLAVEIDAKGSFELTNEELHVLLFNCVRELLFNVVKHADTHRAFVSLQWVDEILQIEVRDHGRGFTPKVFDSQPGHPTVHISFGLPSILHQLSLFSGHMDVRSAPGKGTLVILTVPISESI